LAFAEKWKNQTKWSARTRTQEARKEGEVREMRGQVLEKFCCVRKRREGEFVGSGGRVKDRKGRQVDKLKNGKGRGRTR